MRIIFCFIIAALICCVLVSCGNKDTSVSQIGGVTPPATGDEATETSKEAWDVATAPECKYHHRDYHIIPYHLVKFVGVDESNEWAKEAKKTANPTAPETECSCPDFNIKSFIDRFKVSREDFVTYGDIVYYPTYDLDVLYEKTPEEIGEYFIYSDALLDKTVASQHFQFIETHLKYEYYSEMANLVIYDDKMGSGIYPSIPSLVQKLKLDRGAFEKILEECTERNASVYGESLNFDYDLDMIFNDDGTYRKLPEFSELTPLLRELKLNRMFCGLDE